MMKKSIKKLFILRVKPQIFLSLCIQTLCLGALLFSVIDLAEAAKPDCAQERMAVTQALSAHLPADPQLVKDALLLRREGEVLCQQGDAESGRAKLNKAAAVLNPDSIETDLGNQKGESHE